MDVSEAKKPKEFAGPAARGGERQVDAASGRRHVDAAALKDVLSKNGRARRCRAPAGRDGPIGTAGLQSHRRRPPDAALAVPPVAGHRRL